MYRFIEKELSSWKKGLNRLPLIVRGARQVGKTYTIESFGNKAFESFVSINFELKPEFKKSFENLDPQRIIDNLEFLTNQDITPGKSLLFFDEIQECPMALMALRYFKEKMPEQHVIAAGSLLEFALHDERFSYPTGRVQFMHMGPLSFKEYLQAIGQEKPLDALASFSLANPPSIAMHEHLLRFVREYYFIGGMPAVVQLYRQEQSVLKCNRLQTALYQTYKNDFGKYASKAAHKYLQRLYEKAPYLVAKHFQYTKIDSDMRSRDLKQALEQLCHANLIHQVFATKANGLPLEASVNDKKFKILFLDIGLLQAGLKLDSPAIWEEDLDLINEGALAEQFVGQELLANQDVYQEKKLYFWEREKKTSAAEVDFIASYRSSIVPIEVKAGSTGSLRSLHQFMEERKVPVGVRISQSPLAFEKGILSVPFYLIAEIPNLVRALPNA